MYIIPKEVNFSQGVTLDSFSKSKWNIGESHLIEFFPNKKVNIYLYDTNSDLGAPLKEI